MYERPRDAESMIERMFQQPMLDAISETGKVKRLNLSQSVNDQRVSLHRAYADGCQIIIICSFEGDEDNFGNQFLLLKDSEGNVFWATNSQNDYLEGVGQFSAITFDASEYRGNAQELTLHFEIDIAGMPANDSRRGFMRRMGRSGSHSFGWGGGLVHRGGTQRPALEEWREQHRAGLQQQGIAYETFAFDFSVPFTPARIFDSEPQVEANGAKVTLKQVIVAPSTTRIVVIAEDAKDNPTSRFHMAKGVLTVADEPLGLDLQMQHSSSEGTIFATTGELYEKQGEWTLTITQLQAFPFNPVPPPLDSNGRPDPSHMKQMRRLHWDGFNALLGPWVFKFTLLPHQNRRFNTEAARRWAAFAYSNSTACLTPCCVSPPRYFS